MVNLAKPAVTRKPDQLSSMRTVHQTDFTVTVNMMSILQNVERYERYVEYVFSFLLHAMFGRFRLGERSMCSVFSTRLGVSKMHV